MALLQSSKRATFLYKRLALFFCNSVIRISKRGDEGCMQQVLLIDLDLELGRRLLRILRESFKKQRCCVGCSTEESLLICLPHSHISINLIFQLKECTLRVLNLVKFIIDFSRVEKIYTFFFHATCNNCEHNKLNNKQICRSY